jgi:hypothetical protein
MLEIHSVLTSITAREDFIASSIANPSHWVNKKGCWLTRIEADLFCSKRVQISCILYNQRDATYTVFFIIISALHVSGGFSAHH